MIYQKTLKQLNAIFPKLRITPPVQKITVRSLVQQVEVSILTNHDYSMLRNSETAPKILKKIGKMIQTYLHILENNQAARQQQMKKPLNKKAIVQHQQILGECIHVKSKSEFLNFIQQKCPLIYSDKANNIPTIKQYKEILIYNSIEYYNTITEIQEDEYFRDLEQLTQNLNILHQLTKTANNNVNDLQQFYDIMQKYEVFKKKDNPLTRVINYNLRRTLAISNQIQNLKRTIYNNQQKLTYSICRCYYLCFLAREDICEHMNDDKFLSEIKRYLCDREETVLPKLYNRKIKKCLILFDSIEEQQKFREYVHEHQIKKDYERMKDKIVGQVREIKDQMVNLSMPLRQEEFLNLYYQIQHLLLEAQQDQLIDLRNQISNLEQQVIKAFAFDGSSQSRRFITTINPKLPSSYNQEILSSHRQSLLENPIQDRISQKSEPAHFADIGDDIFLKVAETPDFQKPETKQLLGVLESDPSQLNKRCQQIVNRLDPEKMQLLEDMINFNIDEIKVLIHQGKVAQADFNELRMIQMIVKTLLKPQITEKRFASIFYPVFRPLALKILNEKLVQYRYHLNKLINSSTFPHLPINLKECVIRREKTIKSIYQQLSNIMVIGQAISNLNNKPPFDICQNSTFFTFLKVLLASKQIRFYRMSYQDQKNISKLVKRTIDEKLYTPFLQYLNQYFPKIQNKEINIVECLDEIEFFVDFKNQTNSMIKKYISGIQNDKEDSELLVEELARILEKWVNGSQEKLKMPLTIFKYHQAIEQVGKLKQIIRVCRHEANEPTSPQGKELHELIK